MSEISDKFLLTIDDKVDNLAERISSVEGRLTASTRPSTRKLIAEFGGYAALVISILIGSWTLYNNIFVQPAQKRAQAEASFRNNINSLANLGARVVRAFSESPLAGNAELASVAPQRLALLAQIEKADKTMPHVLKFADRLLLASEYEIFGRLPEAMRQIDLADATATDGYQKANVYWKRARLNGGMGNLSAMRDTYGRALNQLKTLGLKKTAFEVMRLYGSWVAFEINNDDCSHARDVYAKMVQDFKSSDVFPMVRVQIKLEFEAMLQQSLQTCPLDADELDAG